MDNNRMPPKGYKEYLKFICDHMIETRPKKQVVYRPYIKSDFVSKNVRENIRIDLDKFYNGADVGDKSYVYVNLLSQCDTRLMITVKGAVRFYINRFEYIIDIEKAKTQFKEYALCEIDVKEGSNELVFECEKTAEGFFLDYFAAHIYWPYNWTSDYLIWVRDTVPINEFYGEQGFSLSELVKKGSVKTYKESEIVFPVKSKTDSIVDFGILYGKECGDFAVAYSVAKKDGTLKLNSKNNIFVYINGELKENYSVRKGDNIFVVCQKNEKGWVFECCSNDILHLPFVETNRDVHFITLGSFSKPDCPEFQLTEPYVNADGNEIFWRFADEKTYLRPYLDTSFFGQWFYGLMVGEYGILRTSEYYPEFYGYFHDSMRILVDFFDLMQYETKEFGDSAFLKRSTRLLDLDSIGTIGMNLCELYHRETDVDIKKRIFHVISALSDAVYKNIPRMEDGTFYRIETMWADDTYMSCPFLVRMGEITGNTKYYDEVVKQLKLYTRKLYIDELNVFSHIYFPKKGRANRVPWGRGNGWVYLTFAEVIEHLPQNYPGKNELAEIFKKAVSGLCKLQSDKGLWHQVLNMPKSYTETSCTAIFSIAIAKGIKLGILEKEKYLPVISDAVNGLLKYSLKENGDVAGVCRGSGCQDDPEYYARLETITNDDHGTGVVLASLCEIIELTEE